MGPGPCGDQQALSIGSGLLLSVAPGTVDEWLGTSIATWLRLFGIALIGHGILLAVAQGRHDQHRWGRLNLLAIAPYPVLMVVAAFLVGSSTGVALVLIDGLAIAAVALLHARALRGQFLYSPA